MSKVWAKYWWGQLHCGPLDKIFGWAMASVPMSSVATAFTRFFRSHCLILIFELLAFSVSSVSSDHFIVTKNISYSEDVIIITSNVTTVTEVWSTSFRLISYGNVLANTAVLSTHVCVVCLPVCSNSGECYDNTVSYNAACVHAVSLNCAKNI